MKSLTKQTRRPGQSRARRQIKPAIALPPIIGAEHAEEEPLSPREEGLREPLEKLLVPRLLDALRAHCTKHNHSPSEAAQLAVEEFLAAHQVAEEAEEKIPQTLPDPATTLLFRLIREAWEMPFSKAVKHLEGLAFLLKGSPDFVQERAAIALISAGNYRMDGARGYDEGRYFTHRPRECEMCCPNPTDEELAAALSESREDYSSTAEAVNGKEARA